MVVMPDADMDQAVDTLMGAAYGSAGEHSLLGGPSYFRHGKSHFR
jgi:acyl-CoA reductase-like NAD-dependent aldehyde dehydrogenase